MGLVLCHSRAVMMRRSDEQRRAAVAAVRAKMPKQVKRKRRVVTEDGMDAGMEEYIDFIYPDEGAPAPNLKLLEVRYLCDGSQCQWCTSLPHRSHKAMLCRVSPKR